MTRRRIRRIAPFTLALLAVLPVEDASGQPNPASLARKFGVQIERARDAVSVLGSAAAQPEAGAGTLVDCPQAGLKPASQPRPLDITPDDKVEQLGQGGDDQRANVDFSCFPQDETSIDVNPLNPRNAVAGANDYRLGWGSSGVYATTDNGNNWYPALTPFPSVPGDDHLDGGGDPAIVFDRAGVVYYAQIHFERERADNGIFVNRSTNGGFTWSRPCVAEGSPPGDQGSFCVSPLDPRLPGDGTVTFNRDPDGTGPATVQFDDKEYIAAGPRPAGVQPQCFTSVTRTVQPCPDGTVGVDRLYVSWTRFADTTAGPTANIYLSYSDDQARSWSPPRVISGSAPFCTGSGEVDACDLNQFSVPTVHPTTGLLGVAFQNFNTPDENQYLFVRSRDGGQTFEGPFFVTPVFDVNYPRSGGNRPDCTARGQGRRAVLTNSCFRVNSGGAVVFDPRPGAFADDLYLVTSDNRNGTRLSSNTDVFLFRSTDGGTTWIGPTRVNNDSSIAPADRDCDDAGDGKCTAAFGNDQWFPWVDVSSRGDVNVVFYDRRLDEASVAHEWPASRQRPGNYLLWRFGAICSVTTTAEVTQATVTVPAEARECLAPQAAVIPQPASPVDPGAGPVPGQGQTAFPFRNFTISDVPSNWDYSFRGGIFAGDYDVVAIGPDNQAWATWTDARNGRSSRTQTGRNPICEQSDVFVDLYSSQSGGSIARPQAGDELFLVTPCPNEIQDKGGR